MKFLEESNINVISLILVIAFIYPVLMGVIFKLKSRSMVTTLKSVLSSIAMLLAIVLTALLVRDVVNLDKYGLMEYLSKNISASFVFLITKSKLFVGAIFLIVFLFLYQTFKWGIELINRIVLYPLSDGIDRWIRNKGRGTRMLLGGLFQVPKGICYILILTALLSYTEPFLNNEGLSAKLNDSKVYGYMNESIIEPLLESDMAKNFPNILQDSFRIVNSNENVVETVDGYLQGLIYYNGVTLDEGIRSNEEIDEMALKLTKNCETDYEKARILYDWVGMNIEYDDDKATEVMQNKVPVGIDSGAINTFETKKGVCFDYACLYVAMCRANGIPVRLIVGEGYNGIEWISHSWNEVYIKDRDEWIGVDPTFYGGGKYFDSDIFNADHMGRKIAGEWFK